MPKIVTEADRAKMRDTIYRCTINLIRQKGIKKVTVDDITTAAGISKGAFYAYYPSREAGLFEVLNRSRAELFAGMEAIMSKNLRGKERIDRFFREVYLAPSSIIMHLAPSELEIILNNLPPEYRKCEMDRVDNYFQRSLELLQIETSQMETVALLTDCIGMAASNASYGEQGKNQVIDILIEAIADYLEEGQSV